MTATEHAAWLEGRRKGIGSSDAPAVLGLSPWACALDVYAAKVDGTSLGMTPALEWGHRLEPAIAGAIIDRTGWKIAKPNACKHREHDFILANPDRVRLDWDGSSAPNELIEIKTTSRDEGWGEPETDEIPQHYWAQVQHQLAVFNSTHESEVCWVFVLVAGRDFRRYRVPRDPGYLDVVIDTYRDFWRCVETRTPPEPDWSNPATVEAVLRLHKPTAGKAVALDPAAVSLIDRYEALGQEISLATKERDLVKAQVVAAMGDAETGDIGDGRSVRRREIERSEYTVKATKYFEFRILSPKKGKR